MTETMKQWDVYSSQCPTRQLLDRIADKWTVLVVVKLASGPRRFAELKREIGGISQKMLTQTLRALQRDGLVDRKVYPTVPPQVEYSLTELGGSLASLLDKIRSWAETHMEQVQRARRAYDRIQGALTASASKPGSC